MVSRHKHKQNIIFQHFFKPLKLALINCYNESFGKNNALWIFLRKRDDKEINMLKIDQTCRSNHVSIHSCVFFYKIPLKYRLNLIVMQILSPQHI